MIGVGDFVERRDKFLRMNNFGREVLAVDGRTVLVRGTLAYPSRQWLSIDSLVVVMSARRARERKERQEKRQKEGWMFWLGAEGEFETYIKNLPRAVANSLALT